MGLMSRLSVWTVDDLRRRRHRRNTRGQWSAILSSGVAQQRRRTFGHVAGMNLLDSPVIGKALSRGAPRVASWEGLDGGGQYI